MIIEDSGSGLGALHQGPAPLRSRQGYDPRGGGSYSDYLHEVPPHALEQEGSGSYLEREGGEEGKGFGLGLRGQGS